MAANTKFSKAIQKMKKIGKGAWSRSRQKEAKARGARLPGGLINAVAKLSSYNIGEYDNGTPFVSITGIVVEPEEHAGVRAVTKHRLEENDRQTIDEAFDKLSSDIQLLGGKTDEMSEDDIPKELTRLCKASPYYKFNTVAWEFNGRSGTACLIQGLCDEDFTPADPVEIVEEPDADEDENDLDSLSRTELKALITEEELDVKVNKGMSDDDIREAIRQARPGSDYEEEGDEDEEAEPGDEGEEEEEEEEIDEGSNGEDWKPAKEDIYNFKAPGTRKSDECEVTSVNERKRIVSLKRLRDKKLFKDVSWDKLESAGE